MQAVQSTPPANLLNAAIAENVKQNVKAVTETQPVLSGLVSSGKVKVVGGIYDIGTGRVTLV